VLVAWQQRGELRPCCVGELSAANHCLSNLHQLKGLQDRRKLPDDIGPDTP
jgi:hypothetical protein